jgi:transketolase
MVMLMTELSQREAYGQALAEYGAIDPRVVVLDADTSASTYSCLFAEKYPERFYNLGIAEPCMVDVAAGLALGGLVPFVNAFAMLIALRALEQVRTCLGYARTNVKLAASYAGLSDFKDGPTHHSITDIAILRTLPGMTVIVPADAAEAACWVPVIAQYEGPVYFRLSRAATLPVHGSSLRVEIGKGEVLRSGKDVTLIACGSMVGRSVQAAQELAAQGVQARLINMASVKPLDEELILQAAEETGAIVTVEEHSVLGGLGSAVVEFLSDKHPTPVRRLGLTDTFARTALDVDTLLDAYGMGVEDIVAAAKSL